MEREQCERRNFLLGLGKWSKAVIGGVVLGGLLAPGRDANAWGWVNRDGGGRGSWVNFRGDDSWDSGGGPGWYNRPGRWYNRGDWNNRSWNNGGWYNRPWTNGGWNNRGGWFNGPGWGGSWINR